MFTRVVYGRADDGLCAPDIGWDYRGGGEGCKNDSTGFGAAVVFTGFIDVVRVCMCARGF